MKAKPPISLELRMAGTDEMLMALGLQVHLLNLRLSQMLHAKEQMGKGAGKVVRMIRKELVGVEFGHVFAGIFCRAILFLQKSN
jgi:hypothetical protein